MVFEFQITGTTGTIQLEGRFTFERHQGFKAAAEPLLEDPNLRKLCLDLSRVTYMDSSSLGMILLLRQRASNRDLEVVLARPSASARALLDMVQFGKLFRIEEA